MPGNFADSYELPPASGHLTPQQIELLSAKDTYVNDAQKDVLQQIQDGVEVSDATEEELRSVGVYAAELDVKASEGVATMSSRFGDAIPFLKAGASTPSFASMLNPSNLISSAVGVIGSAFGGAKGLLPSSLSNSLVATKDLSASAGAINQARGAGGTPSEDRSHLVSLTSIIDGVLVEFLVMPGVVENRTVGYEAVGIAQAPGSFQKYKGTESTTWAINATFISRTSDEATLNLKYLNILRAWTMPFYGENTKAAYPTRLGAPPPVLMLRGLRKSIIGPMPVVITSLSWEWPKDVDYIPARLGSASNIPFPTVMQFAINCVESLSTTQFNQFSLDDFFGGGMIDAYSKPVVFTAVEVPEPQPDAQYVGGAFYGSGKADARRFDQSHLTSTAGGGRGSVNPPVVVPVISEAKTKYDAGMASINAYSPAGTAKAVEAIKNKGSNTGSW